MAQHAAAACFGRQQSMPAAADLSTALRLFFFDMGNCDDDFCN
jgi:hypothetical protein